MDLLDDSPDNNNIDHDDESDLVSRVRLVDAPVLFFVCFHDALRGELNHLRSLAETTSSSTSLEDNVSHNPELVLELQRRFEFLKLVLKYHCVAEDEVIFPALDVHVKNVICAYSLEHNSTDEAFNSIFHHLDELMDPKNENFSKLFQELICCIGILQATTFQHMKKEEEQVFPLLLQKVSIEEQASLVWQFICSVPIMLLQEILPWMISFLSADKQAEFRKFLNEITPMEKELQEVLMAWLGSNTQIFTEDCSLNEVVQCADAFLRKKIPRGLVYCNRNLKSNSNQMKENCSDVEDRANQVSVLYLWHNAIKKDMKETLEELHQIRNSTSFHNLDSLLIQLKFFADVLVFYSNAQKKFFYPVLSELPHDRLTKFSEQFLGENHIEDLQQLLLFGAESVMPLSAFVEKLCRELEIFMTRINKQFAFQETEVFPVIRLIRDKGMLEELICLSLRMMPLGLLKCVITWFSGHLSENESRSILSVIKQGNPFVHEAFASLLHEWFRVGYSGKASIEKFRQDLRHIFKSKNSLLTYQVKEATRFSFLNYDMPHKSSIGKNGLSCSSPSGFNNVTKYETSYSTGINMHIFFPVTTAMKSNNRPRFQATDSSSVPFLDDSKPIDLIFFFHKAIRNDLDYLVHGSAQIEKNVEMLVNFSKRFHLVCFLHRIHSETEDEIAFPALEATNKVKNISLSYTIDHKFEVEHFNKMSSVLDKMFDLHFSVSSFETNTWEQRMLKHHQLCRKLQEMCKSMHKLLSDHMNREEIEIWHSIREFLSNKEQIKIIGCMLGRIRAETLQDMIPWLMISLTPEEQHVLMFIWSMVAKNTMFDEWLAEWWDGYRIAKETERSNNSPLQTVDPLEIISKYLSKEILDELQEESTSNKSEFSSQRDHIGDNNEQSHNCNRHGKSRVCKEKKFSSECSECKNQLKDNKQTCSKVTDITCSINDKCQSLQSSENSGRFDHLMKISPDDLEMVIKRISRDSSLDLQKKSYIIQNLLMSRWIVRQHISSSEGSVTDNGQEFTGQYPSYRDPLKLIYGCKHYKRSCKLLASCCNQLHTCIHCHNDASDHLLDRKSITKMMCMKCLKIQPIGATCSTVSCGNLPMAKYYCRICRLFDDDREIYHCPYCNLCRVGKGLGLDYFHCMNCNACMSRSLTIHICREKSLEDNCPICHEYIFTSCSPVKALPCGHVMHSTCFQEYTFFNYTCPICCKSLGDMQVYFRMLDALLAEEKVPEEHLGQTQMILCNDCEKKGTAPFHWLYHKCSSCGSYNTRVI